MEKKLTRGREKGLRGRRGEGKGGELGKEREICKRGWKRKGALGREEKS